MVSAAKEVGCKMIQTIDTFLVTKVTDINKFGNFKFLDKTLPLWSISEEDRLSLASKNSAAMLASLLHTKSLEVP